MVSQSFESRWHEAYLRDQPVIEEAQRLTGDDPTLLANPVSLFRLAAANVAAATEFEQRLTALPTQLTQRQRAMVRLLAPPAPRYRS